MTSDPSVLTVVHLVTSDTVLADSLSEALSVYRVSLRSSAEPPASLDGAGERPAALLLDSRVFGEPETLQTTASALLKDFPKSVPLVVLAHSEEIRFRLAAMRAGAGTYLSVSASAEDLAERLVQILGIQGQRPDRILVVDDQPVAALFAARVLQGAGMVTERVLDPLAVMEALDRFAPDLILMDLHMPGASGIELTAVIRTQERFADLPIIFLSSELDPDQQMAALRIGGDDFLSKPVAPDRLVASVQGRLMRVRNRRHSVHAPDSIDDLTRLGTRDRLLRQLDRLIGQIQSGAIAKDGGRFGKHYPGVQRALVYLEVDGDAAALELVAASLAAEIGPGDVAARAADQAVAVLIHRQDALSLAEFAQHLAYEIGQVLGRHIPEARLGAGWYPLTDGCPDSVTLLSRASKAAHWSLRDGARALGRYGSPETSTQEVDRCALVVEAIRLEQLQPLYEPMVALTGLMGERYELTPRLLIGDGELLGPGEFIPIAAKAGLSAHLDHRILLAGLDALKARLDQRRPVQLFIHQSPEGIADDNWVVWLRDQINARDLIRLRPVLQFEVADVDRHLELAIRRARQLARLGIRVCLNGVDFSEQSTRVLQALSSSFVRIGRRVVQGPELDAIAWLIQSVKASGAKVIATGVDGPVTIARLYGAGVDLIQGPYVQPPSPEMGFDFAIAEA
ncbi:response regulator [Thiorhodococcus fuscus]|uniref:Response regulator n=1 Tax=Thiorhodococcus fuscus TaxID=527200 RepID=A0ABW4Y2B9_9GAMM